MKYDRGNKSRGFKGGGNAPFAKLSKYTCEFRCILLHRTERDTFFGKEITYRHRQHNLAKARK